MIEAIIINVVLCGEEYSINTFRGEYRSLMELIRDQLYPECFGECGGMGRCATCQVHVETAHEISSMDRNESSTLFRQGITDQSIRLSCQLGIDLALHDTNFVVLNNY